MKNIVVKIAKETIKLAFENKEIDPKIYTCKYPWLKDNGASFVTLTQNHKLRGCIGSLVAKRPLIEDIMANALNAAFMDPRFPKLKKEELDITDVEVSLLSEPKKVLYENIEDLKGKITPFKDGVILILGSNQATFLPQVWEELPEFESFFGHLLQKAGLPLDSFKHHPEIFIYDIEKYNTLS
ncbi:AmmeMemoRadiSam system protein A [Sulfurospirillum sp. 1307]|jgi:AmmeMemoRadiSam system protein A